KLRIAKVNTKTPTTFFSTCESIGCQWNLTDGILVVKPPAEPVVRHGLHGARRGQVTTPEEGQAILEAFKRTLPGDMKFDNAPLEEISRRLTESVGLPVKLVCKDPDVKTLTMDLSGLTLASALEAIGESGRPPRAPRGGSRLAPLPGAPSPAASPSWSARRAPASGDEAVAVLHRWGQTRV
ncbi:MAG: hypothetical protein MZV63_18240, partial [Marinilabiliales bacterium]|nr:hypothetical protein [Marinilabiliales bacterium]